MNRTPHFLFVVLFNFVFGISVLAQAPEWAAHAVWYQIFPERFRNGDPANDPTRDSLQQPVKPSEKWSVSRWTADWYRRDPWETEQDAKKGRRTGVEFYEHGVWDRRYGGDLQGVLDKLDYLAGLGINAVYFCPLFDSRSSHKYDGKSFHHIDPNFGPDPKGDMAMAEGETADPATWHWTAADRQFLQVIKAAHQRGIRVIMDGVFNHTGRDFFAFKDLEKNQAKSPYKDWYVVYSFSGAGSDDDDFLYEGWWGITSMPVFAYSADGLDMHPSPKAYIFAATKRWMDPDGNGNTADGVDGWRLDAANERPVKFWSDWNAWVRKLNPEAYTSAEIWSDPGWLIKGGHFSAAMNYNAFAYPVKGFLIDGKWSASVFLRELDKRRKTLPETAAPVMQNLIDSHDTDRLASMIVNAGPAGYKHPADVVFNTNNDAYNSKTYRLRKPVERERMIQRLVVLFQMSYVGAPMIYYGDEAGMWGGHDPDNRMPMVWEDLKFDPQTGDPRGNNREPDNVNFDPGVFAFYKNAIALRRNHPALMTGKFTGVGTFNKAQTVAYLRGGDAENLLVVINRSVKPQTVELELPAGIFSENPAVVFVTNENAGDVKVQMIPQGKMRVQIPALTGAVIGK